jgi:hypothetical protein
MTKWKWYKFVFEMNEKFWNLRNRHISHVHKFRHIFRGRILDTVCKADTSRITKWATLAIVWIFHIFLSLFDIVTRQN